MRTGLAQLFLSALIGFAPALFASNPLPFVNQPLVPASSEPGGPGFTLTVTGSQFASTATVLWNGSPRPTTFVSPSKLQAQIAAADIASPRTATIAVTNSGSAGSASNAVYFPVSARRPVVAFNGQEIPSTGGIPLIAADVNGDGIPDLIDSVPGGVGPVEIFTQIGNGDATFQPAVSSPAPCQNDFSYVGEPSIVGDFNNDGKVDILFAGYGVDAVCVLLGNGDGTFQPGIAQLLGSQVLLYGPPVAADFNGDGKLDIALANYNDATILILLGNGDGSFQPPVTYQSGFSYTETEYMAIGDFNRDGNIDLLVDQNDGLAVLFGNGDGTFETGVNIPIAPVSDAGYIIVADFNGDGYLDIALDAALYSQLGIFLGNGDGTFAPETLFPTPFSEGSGCGLLGDYNGDGKLDFICSGYPSSQSTSSLETSVLQGNGDGTFTFGPLFSTSPNHGESYAAADFNGDGQIDLAGASNVPGYLISLQTTLFAQPQSLSFPLQPFGTKSAKQNSTVTNIGPSTIDISSISLVGANAGDYSQTNACGTTLAPGLSCTFTVQFSPKATRSEQESAQIAIADNAISSPQYIDLFGLSTDVVLTPHDLKFGTVPVGRSRQAVVTLENHSVGYPTGVGTFVFYGSDPQDFSQTNNCPQVLRGGKYCTIHVTFTPTQKGNRTASLGSRYLPYKTYIQGTGQ